MHNVYFSAFLLIGFLAYLLDKRRFRAFGVGVIVWGLLNAVNHLVCSVVFLQYEPGIITGMLWIPLSILAYQRLRDMGLLSARLIVSSFLIAVIMYWTMPIVLFIEIDSRLGM